MTDRTDDNEGPHEPSGSADRKRGNNTSVGCDEGEPATFAAQTRSHSVGNDECSCEYYSIETKEVSHFATFPPALVEPCIKAGCPEGGTVLDPFGGSGTVGLVADRLGRDAILIELNHEYAAMAQKRISDDAGMFSEVAAE